MASTLVPLIRQRLGRVNTFAVTARHWSAAASPVRFTPSHADEVTHPSLSNTVKQARPVDLKSIGDVLAPYAVSLPSSVGDRALSARDHFSLGQEVRAVVLKTHSLGLLMTVTASPPRDQDENLEPEQEEVQFTGLMSHQEIDFYRKSAGRGLRLDETYSVFVQSLTADGLMRLSFRPGVRDRLSLGKDAILDALTGE